MPPPPPPDWNPDSQYTPRRKPSRRGTAAKFLAVAIVLILLLYILLYTPLAGLFLAGLTGRTYAESASFTLEREITIDIQSGTITWICDIPLPETIPGSSGSVQSVDRADPVPYVPGTEKYGGDWAVWTGSDSSAVTLRMTYRATVRTVIWDIGAEDSGTAADIPEWVLLQQGGDEWQLEENPGDPSEEYKIWPSHPTIKELSADLTSGSLTVYENTKNVYSYVHENIAYQTVSGSEPKSCLRTLSDRAGDCDDQSILLISLLRAAGIPAWLAFGMMYDSGTGSWGAHAWAEIYIPLREGAGGSVAIDVVNGEFLVRNCNRLEEWKSDGDGSHLSDYYHMLSYNYSAVNPHQSAPVIVLSDDYSGEYEASSGRVYGIASHLENDFLAEVSFPRKVF
jgi:transglutaminase-like putative cysteine protease